MASRSCLVADIFAFAEGEGRIDAFLELCRSNVCELIEGSASGEKKAIEHDVVLDLRVADGAEKNGVGVAKAIEEIFRANAVVAEILIRAPVALGVLRFEHGEDALPIRDDFLANAVPPR